MINAHPVGTLGRIRAISAGANFQRQCRKYVMTALMRSLSRRNIFSKVAELGFPQDRYKVLSYYTVIAIRYFGHVWCNFIYPLKTVALVSASGALSVDCTVPNLKYCVVVNLCITSISYIILLRDSAFYLHISFSSHCISPID